MIAAPQYNGPTDLPNANPTKLHQCCAWTENDEYWETQCGHSFIFCDCAQPTEHKFKFCPFCGNTLIEQREKP